MGNGRGSCAFALPATDAASGEGAAFTGRHARYVLVVLDEGGGIEEALYDAAEGLITNEDARILVIGNPWRPTHKFGKMCRADSGWNVIRIPANVTPNFTEEGAQLVPTLAGARSAQEKLRAQAPVDAVLKEARRPLDLYAEAESMLRLSQSLLARAAQEGKYGPAVEAVGKATRLLDLLGRLTGDLDSSGTTVNVQTNILVSPEWTSLRGRILGALAPYDEAKQAVMLALAEGNPPDEPLPAQPGHPS